MPTIKSTGWTGNTTTWYYSFEYTVSVRELEADVDWSLYIRTKDNVAASKFVWAQYDLLLDGKSASKKDWYFEAKRDKFLDSGSFTVNLDSTNGQGKFTLQLKGSFHSSGTNNNSIGLQDVNITGGWTNIDNCEVLEDRDLGNNSAILRFTMPNDALTNTVEGVKVLWTINNTTPTEGKPYTKSETYPLKALEEKTLTLSFNKDTQRIFYELIPYGSKSNITASPLLASSIAVTYYGAPYFEQGTNIDDDLIYRNQKPTTREELDWLWSAAQQFNDHSPVLGYTLTVFKDNEPIPTEANTLYNSWQFIAGAEPWNFERDENIYLGIRAYSENGQRARLYSPMVYTQDYTFGNNGIVHFKLDSSRWKIGQIWVKDDNNKWQIAVALFVKDEDNKWHIAI